MVCRWQRRIARSGAVGTDRPATLPTLRLDRFHFTQTPYRLANSEAAMNIQLDLRMGQSEFLTWVQAHEGRYELPGSPVVLQTAGSPRHAIILRRLAAAM